MKKTLILIVLMCISLHSFAQQDFRDFDLLDSYENYIEMPREIAYAQLNKSTYLKGENIGFTAYILNKNDRFFAENATNLYCSILDKENKVVKSKLYVIDNGTAVGDFAIDSLFTSGEYTFRAYTNWMRNFKEQNFFEQKITVFDREEKLTDPIALENVEIDAQFLPEGGHFVSGIENAVGVVIKDEKGFGISDIEGVIVDDSGNRITDFKVNELGIGKFAFSPEAGNQYQAKFKIDQKEFSFAFSNIELEGITLTLKDLRDKVAISFGTNALTLPKIQGKGLKLAIHNGNSIKTTTVTFLEKTTVNKVISYKDLSPGVNIFTLFDHTNTPILERQFFNYTGLTFAEAPQAVITKQNDSIGIHLQYDGVDTSKIQKLSVSVLPSKTLSYRHHHNLPSYTLLQPYLSGFVENAAYYFRNITAKKKYELDNLLLTQGWSSYNWDTIFNQPPDYDYDYEAGINFTAIRSSAYAKDLLLYPTANINSEVISLGEGELTFQKNNLFPIEKEKIIFDAINQKGKVTKANLSLQFSPMAIPTIDVSTNSLSVKGFGNDWDYASTESFREIQKLDEAVVTQKREFTRLEELQRGAFGTIEIFDDRKRAQYQSFTNYISQRGFQASDGRTLTAFVGSNGLSSGGLESRNTNDLDPEASAAIEAARGASARANGDIGHFTIANRNPRGPNSEPLIYLDGVLLQEHSVLSGMALEEIDYIEVNRVGLGAGLRGGSGGVIKIVRRTIGERHNNKKPAVLMQSKHEIPLTFSVAKKLYIPRYKSYDGAFFNTFGVVDWHPLLILNEKGAVDFDIYDTGLSEVTLYIEGVSSDGKFFSAIKEVSLASQANE